MCPLFWMIPKYRLPSDPAADRNFSSKYTRCSELIYEGVRKDLARIDKKGCRYMPLQQITHWEILACQVVSWYKTGIALNRQKDPTEGQFTERVLARNSSYRLLPNDYKQCPQP